MDGVPGPEGLGEEMVIISQKGKVDGEERLGNQIIEKKKKKRKKRKEKERKRKKKRLKKNLKRGQEREKEEISFSNLREARYLEMAKSPIF